MCLAEYIEGLEGWLLKGRFAQDGALVAHPDSSASLPTSRSMSSLTLPVQIHACLTVHVSDAKYLGCNTASRVLLILSLPRRSSLRKAKRQNWDVLRTDFPSLSDV